MRFTVWTIVITIIAIAIVLVETRILPKDQRKERAAVTAVTALGWLVVLINLYFPDLPGPNEFVEMLFKPMGHWLTEYAEKRP